MVTHVDRVKRESFRVWFNRKVMELDKVEIRIESGAVI
jgi:hypothetical protein